MPEKQSLITQKYGLLEPLQLADAPWQSIAMNFITDLPLSDGYESFGLSLIVIPKWDIVFYQKINTKKRKIS
jgi:hypothetical protein